MDSNPTIVLVGSRERAYRSFSPYKFIIETSEERAAVKKDYCFYIVEDKSIWYEPIYTERMKNISEIIGTKEIGPVKIIISKQCNKEVGMMLRVSPDNLTD
jgi:hypothetical protein